MSRHDSKQRKLQVEILQNRTTEDILTENVIQQTGYFDISTKPLALITKRYFDTFAITTDSVKLWDGSAVDENKYVTHMISGIEYMFRSNEDDNVSEPTLSNTTWQVIGSSSSDAYEKAINKQNSLQIDGSGVKFPTVDAVNRRARYVTPEDYGAVANGVADDKSAIQNAIDSGMPVRFSSTSYYISGSLILPSGSTLFGTGTGANTNIIITSDAPAIVIKGDNIYISGLSIKGSKLSAASIAQHGISISGGEGSDFFVFEYKRIQISDCAFFGMGGAGLYIRYNGYIGHTGVQVSNTYSISCSWGFNLDERAEYNSFVGCRASECNIGLRISGGNNIFTGGILSDNIVGASIVGGDNNAHSMISSTSLNHNTAYSIVFDGTTNGYNIANCELFASPILIKDAIGIKFNNCDIQAEYIYAQNSTSVEFTGNKFYITPTFNLNWDGTTNTGAASDVAFFNSKFLAAVPSSIKHNQLFNGISVSGGGTFTDNVKSAIAPVDPSDLTNKAYVDSLSNSGSLSLANTGVLNIATFDQTFQSRFTNVAGIVTVYGSITLTNNTATAASFKIALPIAPASNFSSADKLTGITSIQDPSWAFPGIVEAEVGAKNAVVKWQSNNPGGSYTMTYTFMYSIN